MSLPCMHLIAALLFAVATPALAAQPAARPAPPALDATRVLVVGTKAAAPFSMADSAGRWTGLSHELWREAAARLGVRYELRELPLDALLDSVAAGRLDAVVAAVTITPERERRLDFSHPFHVSGLAIAVAAEVEGGWWRVALRFLSGDFLGLLLVIVAVLFAVGLLVWLLERHRNPEQFGGGASGLGASMWWSAVTMTTVGYGDMAPRTLGGRVVAIVWMFAGLILASSFTAAITTALTVGALQGPVQGPEDLPGVRVATVGASTSAEYLASRGIAFAAHDTPAAALEALRRGAVDAVVYDEPILRHLVTSDPGGGLQVLPASFERQYYGIALPPGSALREPLNRLLLERLEQREWRAVLARHLGQ